MNRYKILSINSVLAIIIALLWATILSKNKFSFEEILSTLALICLVAAPVDLIVSVVFFILKKKEKAIGFLLSGILFAVILFIAYFLMKD